MRLIRFKSKLKELIELEQVNLIVFERSQGFHQNAVIVQSELHGILKLYCEESGIEYRAFSPGEIKKHATGKGNAKKEAMVKAAQEKYGYLGKDDNEADAIHLFHLAKSFYQ
jgi:Holliday junction resolvasome RuvABC endonuclease subunit